MDEIIRKTLGELAVNYSKAPDNRSRLQTDNYAELVIRKMADEDNAEAYREFYKTLTKEAA